MGPIKIKITTNKLEGSSEYGPSSSESFEDKENSAVLEKSNKINEQKSESKGGEKVVGTTEVGTEGSDCYSYEGDDCFYTDPGTGLKYLWSKEAEQWVDKETGSTLPASTSTPQVEEKEQQKNYKFDGKTYVYVDKLTGKKHRWNLESSEWEVVEGEEEVEEESEEDENTTEEEKKARQYRKRKAAPGWGEKKYEKDPVTGVTTYTDPLDGVIYELDPVKNAWFPKLDEEFMAVYQLNYGFTKDGVAEPTKPEENTSAESTGIVEPVKKKGAAKQEDKQPPSWFDEEEAKSCKVYVSDLPTTITEQTFESLVAKCGMVEFDVRTKKPKIKLYLDSDGKPKGDGLCTYIKPESVTLALTILDGSEMEGKVISVQRAKFEMKGEYDPKLKPKKLSKKQLEKAKKSKERMFAWVPEKLKGERGKHEKVVVISNMFAVEDLDKDPGLILDYSNNIRSQCSKFGTITKISVYDKNPEGICQVFFKEPSEADLAVQMLNGRMFGTRVMSVSTWDGRTKYKLDESKVEETERLQQWEKYLHAEDKMENMEDKMEDKTDEKMEETETLEHGGEKDEDVPEVMKTDNTEPVEEEDGS